MAVYIITITEVVPNVGRGLTAMIHEPSFHHIQRLKVQTNKDIISKVAKLATPPINKSKEKK